jgi:hypothetical protein
MVGDGMVRKANRVNRGDLFVRVPEDTRQSAEARIGERAGRTGVRATIVARKPRN